MTDSTRSPPPSGAGGSRDFKGVEASLQRFSRRIDINLRIRYATHGLRRLIAPMRHLREKGRPVRLWVPSRWLMALSPLLIAFTAAGKYIPALGFLLPDLPWWTIAVWIGLFIAIERFVVPQIGLFRYRFRLMRLEYREEGKAYPDVYRVARLHDSKTGFGWVAWPHTRDVEPGDIVIAVINPHDEGVAIIPLRTEGRLPVMAFGRELYMSAVLPPISQKVRTLAQQFDLACDQDAQVSGRLGHSRAVRGDRSGKREVIDVDALWASVVLDDATRKRLIGLARDFAEGRATASRGLLLYGPPGTGKTLIARIFADSMGCTFFPLSLTDLKSGHVGQSGERVRALWNKARAERRAVIFVDECESVFGRRGGVGSDSLVEEIVSAFLAEWDGFDKQPDIWVVGATNRREVIDPALMSRFDDQIEIGLPDGPRRLHILGRELARLGHAAPMPEQTQALTTGMSGRDLATLAKRLIREAGPQADIDAGLLSRLTGEMRRQGSTATDADARWETLVLSEATFKELKTTAGLLQHAEVFRKRGISVPRGLLLYGPPGTGKTQIARTLANETGLRFIAASTADIKQGFLGQSGQKVRELFERARESAPSLLFIDEIDVIAGSRGASDAFQSEIVGQLLQEMDGIAAQSQPVFVLAATNRMDRIDAAVLSRLPKRIEIGLPDGTALQQLLTVLMTGKPLDFDLDTGAAILAARAGGMSGRDLRSWVEAAEHRAVSRAIERGDPDAVGLRLEDFIG